VTPIYSILLCCIFDLSIRMPYWFIGYLRIKYCFSKHFLLVPILTGVFLANAVSVSGFHAAILCCA